MIQKYAKDFVKTAFGGNKDKLEHFERTEYWVGQLKSNPSKALLIAAYAYDIERAFNSDNDFKRHLESCTDKAFLDKHQNEGGQTMSAVLISKGADPKLAAEVQDLIAHHEVGGTPEQNVLKDADSIAYFESNAQKHLAMVKENGISKELLKKKFDFMFNRISSDYARSIVELMYRKMIESLEKL